ncbi:GNAT family N-acetyltransferase [Mucilaginibacter sp.]|uniref:GNAT family N-acetyltransferase n=1 Tax=Mucilaginibacter sp. TaxID=1882438 RepID=UPI0035BBF2CD
MEIVPVTLADAPLLLSLSHQTFFDAFAHLNNADDMEAYTGKAFVLSRFEEEISNRDSCFYFARVDGEIAGYIKLNFNAAQTELQDPAALEVERIYVLQSQQGKQIGKRLLNFAIDEALRQSLTFVWLGVWEHNTKAIKFYESKGFTIFGNHPFMLGSDRQTDLLMRLELRN